MLEFEEWGEKHSKYVFTYPTDFDLLKVKNLPYILFFKCSESPAWLWAEAGITEYSSAI